jgi:hypothetical protein
MTIVLEDKRINVGQESNTSIRGFVCSPKPDVNGLSLRVNLVHLQDLTIPLSLILLIDTDGVDPDEFRLMGPSKFLESRMQIWSHFKKSPVYQQLLRRIFIAPCV